jgi:16S rRNA (guanine527-N7)-methyltransferase
VGSTEAEWLVDNVLLDSLLFLRVIGRPESPMLDLGAGAGVPGIPIKIMYDDLRVTLVDAKARRASFLRTVVRELGLSAAEVVNDRAERVVLAHAARFASVVLRCAGTLDRLVPLALELVRPGGMVVVAGGPAHARTPGVTWTNVEGFLPGTTRTFGVARRA